MGLLIDGQWVINGTFPTDHSGHFIRQPSVYRQVITDEHPRFRPESQRYHLYVSYACPWAHRTLIMHFLKDLGAHIDISVVDPDMLDYGWTFQSQKPGCTGDKLYDNQYLYQLYQRADVGQTSRVTVPILWDKHTQSIVNNESSEIIRIFNDAFNHITGNQNDYYPDNQRHAIDHWNTFTYQKINNGVYTCGFATTQAAYEISVTALFSALEQLENHFSQTDYLVDNQLTEADIRLIPTLIRFDLVYHTHFKCNLKRIIDYPNLFRYLTRLRELDAIAKTTHIDHIKRHYYFSHRHINPSQIIPVGPTQF